MQERESSLKLIVLSFSKHLCRRCGGMEIKMNKKFLGLRVATWLSLLACLLVAVLVWMFAKNRSSLESVAALLPCGGGFL